MLTNQFICEKTIEYLEENILIKDISRIEVVFDGFNIRTAINNKENNKNVVATCKMIMANIRDHISLNSFDDGGLTKLTVKGNHPRTTLYFKRNLEKYRYSNIQKWILANDLNNELKSAKKNGKKCFKV